MSGRKRKRPRSCTTRRYASARPPSVPRACCRAAPAAPRKTGAGGRAADGGLPTTDLLGLTLNNARALRAGSGDGIRIVGVVEVEMEGTEAGTIIGQAPAVGSTIQPGGSMLLEVTVEPPPLARVVVPELLERVLLTVTPALESLGLGYHVIHVADPDEPGWTSGPV